MYSCLTQKNFLVNSLPIDQVFLVLISAKRWIQALCEAEHTQKHSKLNVKSPN
jgi:hypothetical protein